MISVPRLDENATLDDLMKVLFNEKELASAKKFIDRNRVAGGGIGGQYELRITTTSIGNIFVIKDNASGEECNVTDFESF